ncbi:MBL fold metallo-hydrolase [Patescibacteria group bacterium]|nr:MBL fold metallo-hydrolase [Patescibacteria group bacterium]
MLRIKKIKLIALGILAISSFLVWSAYFSLRPNDKLAVTFFDVGQGDSALIETPNQDKIIIDGGPDNSVLAKVGRYFSFYDRAVDVLIITHFDSDHLAGAVEIAKNYDIGLIIVNGKQCVSSLCGEFEKVIKQKNIKVAAAAKGQEIDFGQGAKINILLPENQTDDNAKKEGDNNFSVISLLSFGKDSFLFTGDAEDKEEMELINIWPNLTADVLKVGHHGSKNSTNQLFLEKINPKFSVISVGAKNTYGHPHIETIEALKKIGSEIFRTDLGGDIVMETEGKGIMIK